MSLDWSVYIISIVGGVLLLFFFTGSYTRYGYPSVRQKAHAFPPSPPTNGILPWHSFPEKNAFLTYESWIKQYGPIISLKSHTYRYVVIGRYKAAMDVMEKQGGALVDRPRWIAGGELLSQGLRALLTPAGARFKRMRRALHTYLQPKAARAYEPLQESHASRMILDLLESPERYLSHASSFSASFILKLTYGKNTSTDATDPDVLQARKSLVRLLTTLSPGAYLVDRFPWLKYLPWYARELRQGFLEDHTLFHHQLDKVKRQMGDLDSGPSFAKSLLSREFDFGLDETEMAFLVGGLFAAGSHSTTIAICISMMAAARHPGAQAAVHAELGAVIGKTRLPTFEDEESLPVLRAFILESMRWRPIVPPGIAHRATQDIIWGDYVIPAGTVVFGNHWAISRDPEVFPDPDRFDFTRWLTPDGKVRDDIKFPYFGFGRRVCPGQHVAARSIFINTLFILWSFELSVDDSKPADDMAFLDGFADVAPIGLRFKPRMAIETLKTMMTQ